MSNGITKYFVCAVFILPRIHDKRDTRKDLLVEVNPRILCDHFRVFKINDQFYLPNIGTVDEKVWS